MTRKFSFRGLDDDRAYNSVDYRNFVLNHRSSFNSLAETLVAEGRPEKAREALLFSLEKMPDRTVPYDYTSVKTVELLLEVGEKEKAVEIARLMGERADANAGYYINKATLLNLDVQREVIILRELQYALFKYGETELASRTEEAYKRHMESIQYLN
jgi:tetratricopeptide (TPR) repeat protein